MRWAGRGLHDHRIDAKYGACLAKSGLILPFDELKMPPKRKSPRSRRRRGAPARPPSDLLRVVASKAWVEVTTVLLISSQGGNDRHDLVLCVSRPVASLPTDAIPQKLETLLRSPRSVNPTHKIGIFRIWLPTAALASIMQCDDEGVFDHPVSTDESKRVFGSGIWTEPSLVGVNDLQGCALLPPTDLSFHRWERVSMGSGVAPNMPQKEQAELFKTTSAVLGIDLSAFPERLGATIVAVPEERFTTRIVGGQQPNRFALEFRRAEEFPENLSFTATAFRMGRVCAVRHARVLSDIEVVDFGTSVDHVRFDVFDDSGTAIHTHEGHPIRHIGIGMQVVGTRRENVFKSASGQDLGTVVVEPPVSTRTYIENLREWETLLRKADSLRALDQLVRAGRILVLTGGPEGRRTALAHLRELVATAERMVWFIDPFLDGTDLLDFCPRVRGGVEIRALTGGKSIRSVTRQSAWRKFKEKVRRHWAAFRRHTHQASSGRVELAPTATAMRRAGMHVEARRNTGFHDRFLVCDDEVWVIGHSLNAVGEAFGVVQAFPHSVHALVHLEALWDASMPLGDAPDE